MARGPKPKPIADRLWSKVDRSAGSDACWPFTGSRNVGGYGQISVAGAAPVVAHRAAFELENGPVPAGHYVCHHCDNPPCCNPAHLFAGSPADNVADMDAKGRRRNAQPKGEACGKSKLTAAVVGNIRARLSAGVSQRSIAREFETTQANVSNIARRRTWAHL